VITSQLDLGDTLPYLSVVGRGTRNYKSGELGVPLTAHCQQSGATQKPGTYVMKGMVVTYRVGAVIYSERIGPILAVCTPKPGMQACHLPGEQPW